MSLASENQAGSRTHEINPFPKNWQQTMNTTDPIADMLSRMRNAALVRSRTVGIPYSKSKLRIAEVLASSGWIGKVWVEGDPARTIMATLKYDQAGKSVFRSIRRVSTPGNKVYVGRTSLPVVANNLGMAVISTPAGMMTNREARRRGLGGEVMCEVF